MCDGSTRHPQTREDKTMLRVTFDTLVAEHADGAALIDAAWCEGYNVVLVGTQSSRASRRDKPAAPPRARRRPWRCRSTSVT